MKSVSPTIVQSARNKAMLMHSGQQVNWTVDERELGYAAIDIFEFLSVGLESTYFQEKMSKIPYGENKTLRDRFIEVVTKILQVINPTITEGSVAEASINEILNFISEEHKITQEKAIFASIEPDIFNMEGVDMEAIQNQLLEEEILRQGNIDSEVEGPADESLAPQTIQDPFNQKC